MDESLLQLFEQLHDSAKAQGLIPDNDKEAILEVLNSKQEALVLSTIQNILEFLNKALENTVSDNDKAKVFNILAEFAKSDEVRNPCVDVGWISIALKHLENNVQNVVLHALRSIGNICYDNESGRNAILDANGAEIITRKVQLSSESYDSTEDNRIHVVTCGCVLNLAIDNAKLAEEFVNLGAMRHLLCLAKQSTHCDPVLCRMAVSAISQLLECSYGKTTFKEFGGPAIFLQALKAAYSDEELCDLLLEALSPLVTADDDIKKDIVNTGCAEVLIRVVNLCNGHQDDENSIYRLETASDMIVSTLVDDECMSTLFQDGNGLIVQECAKWLGSGNMHLEISGAIALGNLARSDNNCVKLVEKGIHKDLLNLLAVTKQRSEPYKYIQAVFGALKNLALPVPNKEILLADGCMEACLEQLTSQSTLTLGKVLGTMCALMAVPQSSAHKTVNIDGHFDLLISLSKSSAYEDVKVEASRVLALIVKNGQSQEISHKIITRGGMSQIAEIVTSPRVVVQNEALIAMTVFATTIKPEFYPKIRETGLTESLLKLIEDQKLSPQSCYNAMGYLEALSLIDFFAGDLQDAGVSGVLEGLVNHTDENVKKRAIAIVTRLKAEKVEED